LKDLAGKANRGEITDDQYLTQLADILAAIDASPVGAAQLKAYLEAHVIGHTIVISATAQSARADKALDASLIASIKASPAYQLLLAASASVTFSQTADASGSFVIATDPTGAVALSDIAVRTQILDAEASGGITVQQATDLLAFVPGNSYDALRRLYILRGVAVPAWLLPAPISCVVNCVDVTHTYSGPVDQSALLTFSFSGQSCQQNVHFTGTVNLVLTVHADHTVNGTAGATGTLTASTVTKTQFGAPLCLPASTPVNNSVAITGVVDHFTATLNIAGVPGTLVGQLLDNDTIIGQIQVTVPGGGGDLVLSFTLTRI
jgi:hypothetical protein